MTLTEFLEKIEELNIQFKITQRGGVDYNILMIRDDRHQCPICAVANRLYPVKWFNNSQYMDAAEFIGLDPTLAYAIAGVADDEAQYRNDPLYPIIRGLVR